MSKNSGPFAPERLPLKQKTIPAPQGNKYALGKSRGRSSKYKAAFCGEVENYLGWCDENPIILGKTKDVTGENASTMTETQTSPRIPSISGFAVWLGVLKKNLLDWAEAHEEFRSALEVIEQVQETMLAELGRAGEGNPRFAQFLLSAKHGYKENVKAELDVSGAKTLIIGMNVQLEKSKQQIAKETPPSLLPKKLRHLSKVDEAQDENP